MAFGNGNFLSTLLGGPAGRSLAPGIAGDYMRRPASNTNLPRTMGSNLLQRFQASRQPAQQTMTGISQTGTVNGVATPSQYSWLGGYKPPGTPTYSTQQPKPNLQRFVPFTGANGQSMLGGGQQNQSGGGGPFGQGILGGGGGGAAPSGTPQPGDYRTLLAQLFPAFRGQGPMNRAVDDYFLGPQQPDFWSQNQQLR